ncbi:MAG TPA: ATP-binding protein [Melioribacteraceae bacterium]|nr:ATP-binding protein [Melioribacteraceae bacterium]
MAKILIVDDEKGLRLGTKRLLESEGFLVDTAENGTEGIAKGTSQEFDLAVIDLKMPDIEGLEVLQTIKAKYPNTVCFIATAYASIDTAIESTRLGAYNYIPKPFTPEEILHHLDIGYKHRKLLLEAERLRQEREVSLLEISYEKSRLRTIINNINEGVLVINTNGELAYFNNAALKNLDIPDLIIGEFVLNKIPKGISEIVNKYLESSEAIKKSYSTQVDIKPNFELVIEANCSPIVDEYGKISGIVIVLRNISDFKKIEMVKSQFVSMVAHELKTPVAAVSGFLKIIMDESLNVSYEQQREYISRSIIRLKGLLDLVNDLLDISRMEMKTKQREIEKLDLVELLNSTIQFLELELAKKGIEIIKTYQKENIYFNGDQNEITRLFTNILSNAIKYNKDKGEIAIKVFYSTNYINVEISDSGIGMKPEEKAKLFQEFFRAKNEYTRGVSGTGLGLTIVRRIVDSYHGKIEVESEYGKGTTFKIQLPINN